MSVPYKAPEPTGDDWSTWARRLMVYLAQTRSAIVQQTGDETAAQDGYLMFDRELLCPTLYMAFFSYDNVDINTDYSSLSSENYL